eukprot:6477555-Amphidinium_carterae.2
MGPEEFLAAYTPMVDLVLCPRKVERVLAVTDPSKWHVVKDDIAVLTGTSALGAKLFACAARAVVATLARTAIETELDKMMAKTELSDKDVAEATMAAMSAVRDLQGVAELRKKREVQVGYRDWVITQRVDTIEDELELRLQSRLRGWASQCGAIAALPGEAALCCRDEKLKITKMNVPAMRKA